MNNLPEDFDVVGYRRYNPDLTRFDDEYLQKHYLQHGLKEGRIFTVVLPDGFNTDIYRYFNPDLITYTDEWLESHYFYHGQKEKRRCSDRYFDKDFFINYNNITDYKGYSTYTRDIRQHKSKEVYELCQNIKEQAKDYILINHYNTINGATHSLFILANYLKSIKKEIIILDIEPVDEEIYRKYELCKTDFRFYKNDCTLLFWLCEKIQSNKIIVNSINPVIAEVQKWFKRDKLILFSREIQEHYMRTSCYEPDVVLTQKIAKSYENSPILQTPILPLFLQQKINETYYPNVVENIDKNKIIIGMCGDTYARKNVNLFLQVAEKLPEYIFMWIGGKDVIEHNLNNVIHITNTIYPYSYFYLLDYFMLFSEHEPFGNVVIENLYLNKKVLTFKENIYFDFKDPETQNNYFEFQGSINLENAITHILNTATQKTSTYNFINSDCCNYIKKNFSTYNKDFLNLLENEERDVFTKTKNLTNLEEINIRCFDGFVNQLRLYLASLYISKHNFVNKATQQWIINNHNNINFLDYFEPNNNVKLQDISRNISYNNIINTTTFKQIIKLFTQDKINWRDALNESLNELVVKEYTLNVINKFIVTNNINNALGIHLRGTDKISFLGQEYLGITKETLLTISEKYDKVFLATDNKDTQDLFKEYLKDKLIIFCDINEDTQVESITYLHRKTKRYTTPLHTIADFLILKNCKVFCGTYKSTFSSLLYLWRNNNDDIFLKGNLQQLYI